MDFFKVRFVDHSGIDMVSHVLGMNNNDKKPFEVCQTKKFIVMGFDGGLQFVDMKDCEVMLDREIPDIPPWEEPLKPEHERLPYPADPNEEQVTKEDFFGQMEDIWNLGNSVNGNPENKKELLKEFVKKQIENGFLNRSIIDKYFGNQSMQIGKEYIMKILDEVDPILGVDGKPIDHVCGDPAICPVCAQKRAEERNKKGTGSETVDEIDKIEKETRSPGRKLAEQKYPLGHAKTGNITDHLFGDPAKCPVCIENRKLNDPNYKPPGTRVIKKNKKKRLRRITKKKVTKKTKKK